MRTTVTVVGAILVTLLALSAATDTGSDLKWLKVKFEQKEGFLFYRLTDFAPAGGDNRVPGVPSASAVPIYKYQDPNGETMGTSAQSCVVTSPGEFIGAIACVGTYVFEDGTFTGTYWTPADTPNISVAITGGTGKYEGAYGAVYITNIQPPPEGIVQQYKFNFNIYIPVIQW